MKKEFKDTIKDYIADNPDTNATKLADLILEDGAISNKSHRTIRGYVRIVKETLKDVESKLESGDITINKTSFEGREPDTEDIPQEEGTDEDLIGNANSVIEEEVDLCIDKSEEGVLGIVDMTEEEQTISPYDGVAFETMSSDMFDVSNLTYHFTVSKKLYTFPVKLVDRIFCAYSRKGLNLTKHQIMTNLGMEPNEFNVISNKLNLTKESQPFGPFSDEFMEPEDIYAAVMENTKSLLGIVKDTDSATLEALIKEYKVAYVELCNKNLKYDTFLKELSNKLSTINISAASPRITNPTPFLSGVKSLNVVLTDLHMGLSLPIYNYTIIEEKLDEIAKDINSVGAISVNISFLGDTVHTISGINHANMWKTIEPGAWGANAIIKPFEILMNFFAKINNLDKIISVSGNHDRMHNDRNLEESNEGAMLLFYMIDTALKGVEILHTNHRTLHKDGNLVFINLHGDQGLDKKPSENIAWKYGDQTKFNFILEGHFHSRIIPKDADGDNFRKMHCPSVCPTDGYAERLGLGSTPGWLMIIEREGLPMVIDIPILYN